MGNKTDIITMFASMAIVYVVLFIVVPLLAAMFIHQGFEKFKIPDVPFRKCVQACFYASSATIVMAFTSSLIFKPSGEDDGKWLFIAVYLGTQLLVVPLLIRQRSGRALLIQLCGIVLAAVCGYGVVTLVSASLGGG